MRIRQEKLYRLVLAIRALRREWTRAGGRVGTKTAVRMLKTLRVPNGQTASSDRSVLETSYTRHYTAGYTISLRSMVRRNSDQKKAPTPRLTPPKVNINMGSKQKIPWTCRTYLQCTD